MNWFLVGLEIPGSLGSNVVIDHSVLPSVFVHLHFELDGIPDALFTKMQCYIARAETKRALVDAGCSGIRFDEVEISLEPSFAEELGDDNDLGEFFWMKVEGVAFHDDFGLIDKYPCLVISQKAIDLLDGIGIPGADVELVEEAQFLKTQTD